MKKIISIIMAAAMLCGAAMMFASCSSDSDSTSDLDYIKENGKLVIGITEYAPMDYKDENGEWTGFDAEYARMFAEKLGVEAEFVVIDWDNKLLELSSKSIDCIWNGMTITAEITSSCAVSNPYVKNQQVVVMKSDIAGDYTSLDDMTGLSFAAESGSAGESAVVESVANYTAVAAQSDALLEVESGSVQACVIDATMAAAMTGEGTSYSDLVVAAELTNEEYGVAFRKDSDLCTEFNSYMEELKADGSLEALASKYGLTLAD